LLPVSGIALTVREPAGEDELFVVETELPPLLALLGLAQRVASTAAGDPVDWALLPAADLDAAALIIRRSWLGDAIRTDTTCPDCRERIDVSFAIGDYIEHHRPRRARGVARSAPDGWFTLAGADVRFRIPTVADLLAAAAGGRLADTLSSRCVEAAEISRALAGRLDRALSALAPSLDDLLGGKCPACGREVAVRFDPVGYVMADLRSAFSGIYHQTHAVASAYGWPEAAILALPSRRRRHYALIIAGERPAA
jgi:hypothetical protein